MARIENTSGRRYEINWNRVMVASIPRCDVDQVTGARVNGSAEIADDVLDQLMAGDDWTKAVFASGDLVRVGAPAEPTAPPSEPLAPPAPADPVPSDNKGKPKR